MSYGKETFRSVRGCRLASTAKIYKDQIKDENGRRGSKLEQKGGCRSKKAAVYRCESVALKNGSDSAERGQLEWWVQREVSVCDVVQERKRSREHRVEGRINER